jgi:hypothetical protein
LAATSSDWQQFIQMCRVVDTVLIAGSTAAAFVIPRRNDWFGLTAVKPISEASDGWN